jgi:ABC-type branched-subunit amino acid transport system permease subunit
MLYRTRKRPPLYHFMLITTIITLLNPISWPYWMIFTLPAFSYITLILLTPPYQKLPLITSLALFYGILAQGQNFDWGRNGGTIMGNLLIAGLFIYLTETRPLQNLNQV